MDRAPVEGSRAVNRGDSAGRVVAQVQVRAGDRQDPRGPVEASHDGRGARLAQAIRRIERDELALLPKLVDARRDGCVLDGREQRGEHVVRAGCAKRRPGGLVERRADAHGPDGPELVDQRSDGRLPRPRALRGRALRGARRRCDRSAGARRRPSRIPRRASARLAAAASSSTSAASSAPSANRRSARRLASLRVQRLRHGRADAAG